MECSTHWGLHGTIWKKKSINEFKRIRRPRCWPNSTAASPNSLEDFWKSFKTVDVLCGFIPINLNSKPLFCFTNELHFHTLFHTDFPLLYRIYFFVSCAVRTGPTKDTGLARQCQTCVMQEIWQNVQPSWQRFTFGNLCRSSDSIRDGSPEKPIGAPWVGTFILSVAGQSVCECVFFFSNLK